MRGFFDLSAAAAAVLLWAGEVEIASILAPSCAGPMSSAGNRPITGTSIFDEDSVLAAVQQPINRGRPNPPTPEQSAPAQRTSRGRKTGQWPLMVRIIVSLFVCWHLLAVFMAPLSVSVSMATEPGRPDDQLPIEILVAQRPPMQWYLDALYLNHGYSFFAPEPGIGYLIHYDLLDGRGGVVKQGSFPDSEQIWPRLRYHRFLMLASQCEVPAATESEGKALAADHSRLLCARVVAREQ